MTDPKGKSTVGELATLVEGRVVGDPATLIHGVAGLQEATEGQITFLANPKYASLVAETNASAILLGEDAAENLTIPAIVVKNPDAAFIRIVERFGADRPPVRPGIHPSAVIDKTAKIGENVSIGPLCVVEEGAAIGEGTALHAHVCIGPEAKVGRDCILHSHVLVEHRCEIGDRVRLHGSVVIGSDGFGYATVEGVHVKIPQLGIVVVEDDVEIGAGTAIDRARFDRTVIGRGSKIDNLVQIAHNVKVGPGNLIAAHSGISGSSTTGEYVIMAGQAGVAGHVRVGNRSILTANVGVIADVPDDSMVSGFYGQDHRSTLKSYTALRKLPELAAEVRAMRKRIRDLEKQLSGDSAEK